MNPLRLDGPFTVLFTSDESWLKSGEDLFKPAQSLGPLPRRSLSGKIRAFNKRRAEKMRKSNG